MIKKFCPKCGRRLALKPFKGKKVLKCKKCGIVRKEKPKAIEATPEVIEPEYTPTSVKVFSDWNNVWDPNPRTTAQCKKCGNDVAYWWLIQFPNTQVFRCAKCNHTWRIRD